MSIINIQVTHKGGRPLAGEAAARVMAIWPAAYTREM